MQNLLPHRATISTEIGDSLREYTPFLPRKAKALAVVTGLGFLHIGRGKMHICHDGQAANSVRTHSEKQRGGRRDLLTAAQPLIIVADPSRIQFCCHRN